jgi:hypothetical protein
MLEALTPEEVNSWSGKDLSIEVFRPIDEENASTSTWGPRTLAFTPETFLLSYSLPNFYFHAVTAYDILRTRGVPIGKGDYEGQLRTRTAEPAGSEAVESLPAATGGSRQALPRRGSGRQVWRSA